MGLINKYLNVAPPVVGFLIIIGVSLLISGIYCLCRSSTSTICTIVTNYEYDIFEKWNLTDCKNDNSKICHVFLAKWPNESCKCVVGDDPFKAINTTEHEDVVLLYQLDTFNKSNVSSQPNFLKSRDDRQLSGILTGLPSETCDPYRYDNNSVTIAPCGAIADAMYNDNIYIKRESDLEEIPILYTGLLTETQRKGFRNPPLTTSQDLRSVFQNFTKPKHWQKNIWELDTSNPDNNGFQNEGFIAWMNTDLELKPMWRLNKIGIYKNGLPAGEYRIEMDYKYPRAWYDGPRNIILARRRSVQQKHCEETANDTTELYYIGSSAVGIALILLLLAAAYIILAKFYVPKNAEAKIQNDTPGNAATLPLSDPGHDNNGQ